jgi:hypothetical protein
MSGTNWAVTATLLGETARVSQAACSVGRRYFLSSGVYSPSSARLAADLLATTNAVHHNNSEEWGFRKFVLGTK